MNAPALITKAPYTFPAAMKRGDAAAHCGVSAGHFDKLVKEGAMPPCRNASGVKIWLRGELEVALYELDSQETKGGQDSCDEAFGV